MNIMKTWSATAKRKSRIWLILHSSIGTESLYLSERPSCLCVTNTIIVPDHKFMFLTYPTKKSNLFTVLWSWTQHSVQCIVYSVDYRFYRWSREKCVWEKKVMTGTNMDVFFKTPWNQLHFLVLRCIQSVSSIYSHER